MNRQHVYAPPNHHAVLVIPIDATMGAPEYAHVRTLDQVAAIVCLQGQNAALNMHVDRCPSCPFSAALYNGFYVHQLLNPITPTLVIMLYPGQGGGCEPNKYLSNVGGRIPVRGTVVVASLRCVDEGSRLKLAPLPACIGTVDSQLDLLRYYGRSVLHTRTQDLHPGTVNRVDTNGNPVHVLTYDPNLPAGSEAEADTDEDDGEHEWCWTVAGERVKVNAVAGVCSDEE